MQEHMHAADTVKAIELGYCDVETRTPFGPAFQAIFYISYGSPACGGT